MKNATTIIQHLAREVRRDTLQVLAATEPSWLTWAPAGTSNHILWHAGHALWLQNLMCVEPLSGAREAPPGWSNCFGMNSQPQETTAWPTQDLVEGLLADQLDRMIELLDDAKDEDLERAPRQLHGPRTLAEWIIHGLHDEAKHCGEMYLLWKMCRADSG